MSSRIELEPVGWVRSGCAEAIDDGWDAVPAAIELDPARFDGTALRGLDAFSHVEVLWLLDRVDEARVERGARRPRGRRTVSGAAAPPRARRCAARRRPCPRGRHRPECRRAS